MFYLAASSLGHPRSQYSFVRGCCCLGKASKHQEVNLFGDEAPPTACNSSVVTCAKRQRYFLHSGGNPSWSVGLSIQEGAVVVALKFAALAPTGNCFISTIL